MATVVHLQTPQGERTLHPVPEADPRNLAELLAAHGMPLNTRCALQGCCEGCRVALDRGEVSESASLRRIKAPESLLACRAEWISGDEITLNIPIRSLLPRHAVVADDFRLGVPISPAPLFAGKYGLAVDIGTTTVAVLLAELASGRILAKASGLNRQMSLGDDVVARIGLCQENPAMLARLQRAVAAETIQPLAAECCAQAGIAPGRIDGMVVAGNTAMLHLLLGVDPSPLGVVPFTPRFLDHQTRPARDLGLCDLQTALVHVLPGLAAYVGADIAAGLYASGLHEVQGPALFVDIGTNGEIVLVHEGEIEACATAAGPAFEGCGLVCGTRATQGAIESIRMNRDAAGGIVIDLETIGGSSASCAPGFCGSAYVDFLAQARAAGILMANGRFDPAAVAANPSLFQKEEHGLAMILAGSGQDALRISEPDVARLLQSKAAIAAGIGTLLERAGLLEIPPLYLAGGFGMHLDIGHAIACGLLPEARTSRVEVVGNTALGGAYAALLDRSVPGALARLQTRTRIVELNLDPGFEDRYIDNLRLTE